MLRRRPPTHPPTHPPYSQLCLLLPCLPCSEDRGGTNMQHFCERLHKTLVKEYQYGLVWGTSSKHMPQR